MKLPEVITLGKIVLQREHEDKRPTNVWNDDSYRYTLTRNKAGKWQLLGSPLRHCYEDDKWHDTPEAAYLANLEHQIVRLKLNHQASLDILTRDRNEARILVEDQETKAALDRAVKAF